MACNEWDMVDTWVTLKRYQWALKIDLDMFQLICSQLGQFYENLNFNVQKNAVPKKMYFSKKISNF